MVAGKAKLVMGLQKSPANSKSETPPPKHQHPSPNNAKASQKTVFSRSFGVYFPRSSAQVQPRPPDVTELLRLVEELRDRESRLKTELLELKLLRESVSIIPVLENEISAKEAEIQCATKRMESLEADNDHLRREFDEYKRKVDDERKENQERINAMEAEISELKRTASERRGLEVMFQNDELSASQRFQGLVEVSVRSNLLKSLRKGTRCTDIVVNQENLKVETMENKKQEAEADNGPRHSRCNSEELAESDISSLRSRPPRVPKPPPRPSNPSSSPSSSSSSSSASSSSDESSAWSEQPILHPPQMKAVPPPPPPPPMKRAPATSRPLPLKCPPPPPPPPPPPKCAHPKQSKCAPPPPPPPPLRKGTKLASAKVRRVPEVVEFYHSLMRRDSRRDSGAGTTDAPATANVSARDMIGEIENRSAHLLAIKTDIETQGDFIRILIKEVENASFAVIEDVVPFVKWLDDELSYLVDERAVLKHFEWPEQKADALREAAFSYCDLKKLESDASSYRDDSRQPCGPALKKLQALFEKLEHGVYNLSRMRESASNRYKLFQIPVDWMLDTGFVSQIKLASVKLAMKYMKRVSAELETVDGGPEEEELIVQGVRFAFRVHQFAGGFDVETMRAFQELRDKANSCQVQCQNQHQRFTCSRSAAC